MIWVCMAGSADIRVDQSDKLEPEGQFLWIGRATGSATAGRVHFQVLHAGVRKLILEVRQELAEVVVISRPAQIENCRFIRKFRENTDVCRHLPAELGN